MDTSSVLLQTMNLALNGQINHVQVLQDSCDKVTEQISAEKQDSENELMRLNELMRSFQSQFLQILPSDTAVLGSKRPFESLETPNQPTHERRTHSP